jgi:hypothetical protein
LKGEQMTFKSRLMFGLVIALVLAMAPSSFAQIFVSLIPDPSTGEIQTNENAQTGVPGTAGSGVLVSGQIIASSFLTATTLRIVYPSPITSSPASFTLAPSIPSVDPIRIEGASGVFAALTAGSITLSTSNSRIEILLPGTTSSPNTLSGSFRLVGVRIDANGKTGAQSITASLDSSANNYILQTPGPLNVINALGPGIGTMAIGARGGNTSNASATIFTNRTVPDPTGSLTLTEGIAAGWRNTLQSGNSGTATPNGSNIRLTFNGVPAGVTITLAAITAGTPAPPTINISNSTITATSSTSVISFTGTSSTTDSNRQPSLTAIDSIQIDYSVGFPLSSTAAVTTPGSISVTATMFPNGNAVDNNDSAHQGLPTATDGYPRFLLADVGPVTVVNIAAASTTLLIPLAEKVSVFDTGISVANTTADPFGTGGGGATASAGTLRFDFFPTTATGAGVACTLTTSSTTKPGFGIASDGTIPAGSTYVVLLSQLLPASNCAAGDFVGYIFIQANFLNAHGQATISDFRSYSLATNVLILPPPPTTPRSTPGGSVESLAF